MEQYFKKIFIKIFGSFLFLSFFSIFKLRNDFYGQEIIVLFILLICVSQFRLYIWKNIQRS